MRIALDAGHGWCAVDWLRWSESARKSIIEQIPNRLSFRNFAPSGARRWSYDRTQRVPRPDAMTDQRRDLLKIRVELIGISPPVWREILVPARYSFWDLHVAIQDAMGWLDYHLHEFRIGGASREDALLFGIPAEEIWDDSPEVLPGWDVPVIDFLSEAGDRAEYEYDFGDGWVHEITLLGVEPREKGQRYPKCVAGERACPPEDCGGVHGYGALLEVLFDPSYPEHESLSQWIPRGWGPELFKAEKVRFDNPLKRWEKAFTEADR